MYRFKRLNLFSPLVEFFRERSLSFLRENSKLLAQAILTLLFIGLAIWFIKNERHELSEVSNQLYSADWRLVLLGILLSLIYIVLQGLMYVESFASIRHRIPLWNAIILFLKRNLISIFLPAGGVSSLAFFTGEIESKGITKSQINFASMVYGFVGILSIVVVALPVFIYALFAGNLQSDELMALFYILLMVLLLYLLYRSLMRKSFLFNLITRYFPSFEVLLLDIQNNRIERKHFIITLLYSVLIEYSGYAQHGSLYTYCP